MMLDGNIFSLFVFDTLMATNTSKSLSDFMRTKHGWTKDEFEKYYNRYLSMFSSPDLQAALASLNSGQREDVMEYEIITPEKGKRKFIISHGDMWKSNQNDVVYIYLYNPHLFKYMFRRRNPIEAIWWDVHSVVTHSEPIGNIFKTAFVYPSPEQPLTQA